MDSAAIGTKSTRPRNYVPTEALHRFSKNLETDSNPQMQKYLAANKERVHKFIAVPFNETIESSKLSYRIPGEPDRSHIVAGLNKYPQPDHKTPLSVQSSMEYQTYLGPKSRFGEGDGSFIDLWLTNDAINSRHLYDRNGFPTQKHSSGPLMGFKRYNLASGARQSMSTVTPYALRREERLRREAKEKEITEGLIHVETFETLGCDLNDAFPQGKSNLLPPLPSSPEIKQSTLATSHSQLLTSAERANYFGEKARAEFFDYYRHLSRHRFKTASGNVDDLYDFKDNHQLTAQRRSPIKSYGDISNNINRQYDDIMVARQPLDSEGSVQNEQSPQNQNLHSSSFGSDDQDSQLEPSRESGFYVTEVENHQLKIDDRDAIDDQLNNDYSQLSSPSIISSPNKMSQPSTSSMSENKKYSNDRISSEMQELVQDLQEAYLSSPQPSLLRPSSARRKFIVNCLNEGIAPRPSALIRKYETPVLDISSKSIGDAMAIILAKSLDNLPLVESINIADNNLTDPGLAAIIKALALKPAVTSVDISKNKVDDEAAEALFDYISSPDCNIKRLIMANADIDDIETSRFIEAISQRGTITELDLSGNLLGSHEVRKWTSKSGSISSGGETIGAMLANPQCAVTSLKLSWNKIHYGAIPLVDSLNSNRSLTFLDLSFNGLGTEGGELLGNALHSHKHLITLKIANNNIKPRACYTIASGIRSCRTLLQVDISDNPIGEVGAGAITKLNLYFGSDVDIDISGCSVRLKDPTCWFNVLNLKKSYRFDLASSYERACCIDLFRYIAEANNTNFSKFKISSASLGTQELSFFKCMRRRHHRSNVGLALESDEILASRIYNMTSTPELIQKLFCDWDVNHDGALDTSELVELMKSLGVEQPKQLVTELMAIYDTDGSGVIEQGEFALFTESLRDHINQILADVTETHYLSLQQQDINSSNPKVAYPDQYLVPNDGIVECNLVIRKQLKNTRTVNAAKVASLVKSSKSVTDGAAMIHNALNSMHVKYAEAHTLYRLLVKESGDRVQVLHKLIPRLDSASDAKVMISNLISESIKDFYRLRSLLGSYYRICMGIPNGFYSLNLTIEVDRNSLDRLFAISSSCAHARVTADLCDTSQHGDWLYFRNVVLDGSPFMLDIEWLSNIPSSGKLEFDFIAPYSHPVESETMSNTRLCKTLEALNIDPEACMHIHKMNELDKQNLQRSKGVGGRSYEVKANHMAEAEAHLDALYATYLTRTTSDFNLFGNRNAFGAPEIIVAKEPSKKGSLRNSGSAATSTSTSTSDINLVDIMATHIRSVDLSIPDNINAVANRTFDALEVVFSGRLLTCVQLATVVERFRFHYSAAMKNKFSSWAVELVIMLFSQIADLINFEHVLKVLQSQEHAMLLFRVGWLHIWNPLKPEGCVVLNLARREERQIMRMIVGLAFIEDGENLIDESYRPTPTADPEPDWNLSLAWVTENGLPTCGVVSLRYYAGEGLGLNNCAANVNARMAFISVVLAVPYVSEAKLWPKASVARAESVMETHGIKLYFSVENQAENSKPRATTAKSPTS